MHTTILRKRLQSATLFMHQQPWMLLPTSLEYSSHLFKLKVSNFPSFVFLQWNRQKTLHMPQKQMWSAVDRLKLPKNPAFRYLSTLGLRYMQREHPRSILKPIQVSRQPMLQKILQLPAIVCPMIAKLCLKLIL